MKFSAVIVSVSEVGSTAHVLAEFTIRYRLRKTANFWCKQCGAKGMVSPEERYNRRFRSTHALPVAQLTAAPELRPLVACWNVEMLSVRLAPFLMQIPERGILPNSRPQRSTGMRIRKTVSVYV